MFSFSLHALKLRQVSSLEVRGDFLSAAWHGVMFVLRSKMDITFYLSLQNCASGKEGLGSRDWHYHRPVFLPRSQSETHVLELLYPSQEEDLFCSNSVTGLGTPFGCPFLSNTKKSTRSNEGNCIPLSLTVPKLIFLFIALCLPRIFHQPVFLFPSTQRFSPSAYLLSKLHLDHRTTDLCSPSQGHPLELCYCREVLG